MLAALAGNAAAERTFEEAEGVLGYDPRSRDDARSLESTENVQVGLFLCGVASARALAAQGVSAQIVAGHSIGAFGAAVTAGAIAFEDALRAVCTRGRAMTALFPDGYGMGVCVGVAVGSVRTIVERARARGACVYVANVNASAQVVVSGAIEAIDDVLRELRAQGARRAERLPVSAPSHCELMEPVAGAVRRALRDVKVQSPRCAYMSSVRPAILRSAAEIAEDLSEGVCRAVNWEESARLIVELGVRLALETVPGHVLTDLWEHDERLRAVAMDGVRIDSIRALAGRVSRET
jgi:malonate decarboxylase epsilon subunit